MKIIYLSPVPWKSISQRPHFFIKEMLEQGADEILWIDPYPGRFPNRNDLVKSRHQPEPFGFETLENLTVISPGFIAPIEPLAFIFDWVNFYNLSKLKLHINEFCNGDDTILIAGRPSRLAIKLISKYDFNKVFFDVMDNYSAFYHGLSRLNMKSLERKLASLSDLIFCSSHELFKKFNNYTNVEIRLNACSYDKNNESMHVSYDGTRPYVFGYIGTLASWFDWDWVIDLASKNPKAIVRIIGPSKTLLPSKLPDNIELLPAISHDKVKDAIQSFDIGLIPFKLNDITKYVDPVKFYEYLANGKPVLSTEFGEMPWHFKEFGNIGFEKIEGIEFPPNSICVAFKERDGNSIPTWKKRFKGLLS